jgi:16S rRNA (guanine1207-N2)-methyltransferase
MQDSALEALFWPFQAGLLQWPADGGAFLRARDGWPLHEPQWSNVKCEQSFKPEFDALQRSGLSVVEALDEGKTYSLILILPPRQREEARALFARAVAMLSPGGRVIAAISNSEGARSGESDLSKLAGSLEVTSKHKCRVFWTSPNATIDVRVRDEWRELDAPRLIESDRFWSRPGIFAWDRIDPASALLAEHLPNKLSGSAADLGAGFGYLTYELLQRCPRITSVDVYEAERRALALAVKNLEPFESRSKLNYRWHDVAAGLSHKYDVIVTNPPFHAQRGVDRPDIGRRFISVAAEALNRRGRLWLVANRHLPYEAALAAEFSEVRTVTQQFGFKIVEAVKR